MDKLAILPIHFMAIEDGVIIKRGRSEILIRGKRSSEVLQTIVDTINKTNPSKDDLCNIFAKPDRPAVNYLINELINRRIIVPYDGNNMSYNETSLDILYWQMGENTEELNERINKKHIVIIGANTISLQLSNSLKNSGIKNFKIFDYSMFSSSNIEAYRHKFPAELTDFSLFEKHCELQKIDCLIATSENGGLQMMRRWNNLCIKLDCIFMPVVLEDLIGYVGPLVIPNETACFECFLTRRNANTDKTGSEEFLELKILDSNRIVGFHPSMASILGDIVAFEIIKFYAEWKSIFNVGKMIKVNLLGTGLDIHKVLKIPRCKSCSPLNSRVPINLAKSFSTEI
jgi:thiazole/oxazole-forming peptide maturase SagC family component